MGHYYSELFPNGDDRPTWDEIKRKNDEETARSIVVHEFMKNLVDGGGSYTLGELVRKAIEEGHPRGPSEKGLRRLLESGYVVVGRDAEISKRPVVGASS